VPIEHVCILGARNFYDQTDTSLPVDSGCVRVVSKCYDTVCRNTELNVRVGKMEHGHKTHTTLHTFI
jgi:hypothetical protein